MLSLQCEAFDYSVEPLEYLDAARTALFQQTNLDALNALGFAFQSAETTVAIDLTIDTRTVNTAILDIHLAAVATNTITQTGQGWIDFVNTTDVVPVTLS